ncbi:pyridoxal phosphate-dependent aminotransferase [Candidatus Pelagibacter sp. HIMB1485]|uniref:pyridoxal phosphate-dependent aminotransferase n=1 Tax=Candidatus Pelagibacter sp. HIMB1485 TaxID=3415415 RepID=UPI003F8541A0
MNFSKKVIETPQALSVYLNQLVYELKSRKKNIVTLSLGESFFDIPYLGIENVDFSKGYHYSDSKGLKELRIKIANFYNKFYNTKINYEKILISAGSKIILYMCFLSLLNNKEEILIHEPAWLSYKEQVKLANGKPIFFPFNENLKNLNKYIGKKTKAFVINNPNNPVGKLYTKKELNYIFKICRKRKIYLIVDEAYSDFVIGKKFFSCANLDSELENLIIVNSLSKNMGMSGWRIGYLITNPKFLILIEKLNQHLITCAPTFLQMYMEKNFEKILSYTLPQIKNLLYKRQRIQAFLKKLKFKFLEGNSTFYFFIDITEYKQNAFTLCVNLLIDESISIVPGNAYGENTNNFLRISIGTESEDKIYQSLKILKYKLEENNYTTQNTLKKLDKNSLARFD